LVPERINDFANSILDHADACGRLPIWPIWGGETGTMIGEPALPILADFWAKGFRGFDGSHALAEMVRTSSEDSGLSQWSIFDKHGFYPFDLVEGESVSRSLEAGIGDDAVARMATLLEEPEIANRFRERSHSWRKLIDPETHLARGRDASGNWREPFDPLKPTSPLNNPGDYTEGNAWQFTMTPGLFDPIGLKQALGGEDSFRSMLDQFFFDLPETEGAAYLGQEAMIGQYAHGNEPSHHIAWLYAYTNQPQTGNELIRRIAAEFYSDRPDGILGNEDAGQLSAWYVFATLGFYPAQSASASYVAGVPLVERARISLAGGRELSIERSGTLLGLSSVRLEGRELNRLAIAHADLALGGVLRFQVD
jgi:predicted alpha-1,2-mannosidase